MKTIFIHYRHHNVAVKKKMALFLTRYRKKQLARISHR